MTPDSIKTAAKYKEAKAEVKRAWNDLRAFNRANLKQLKEERAR